MKPNFALSLSFEGIRLLHRAAGGWRIVGEVALDAADMAAELAVLRRTATALDPSGLRTKLLLPNAQIKYLTIDTADMDQDARSDAARSALDGATPYAVEDLAFDISADGAQTHVAAVARETLAEAEEFATEHRFNPVSFAAAPDENPYLGEPFFGPAKAAQAALEDGDTIEADGIAVVIIGDVETPDAPVVEVAEIETVEADSAEEDAVESIEPVNEEAQEAATVGEVEEPSVETSEPEEITEGAAAEEDAETKIETGLEDEPLLALETKDADPDEDTTEPEAIVPAQPPEPDSEAEIPAPPVFKTRAVIEDTPVADESVADDKPAQSEAPAKDEVTEASEPQPVETVDAPAKTEADPADVKAKAEEKAEASTPQAKDLAKADGEDAYEADLDDDDSDIPPMPTLGPASRAAAAATAAPVAAPSVGFASRRAETQPPTPLRREPAVKAPTPASPAPAPSIAADSVSPAEQAPASKAASSLAVASAAAAPIGRFLSRRKAKANAAPARPALATAIAAPQSEVERMTVFGARRSDVGGKPRFLGLILTAALLVFLAGVAAWASVFLDEGLNLSRLFGDRTARETATVTPDPEQTEAVVTASLDPTLTPEDSAVLDALRDPVTPSPVKELTQRELEALYATTGIWPQAPNVPPEPTGLVNIDGLYLTGIDPISTANDAVALPTVVSFGTDLPLGTRVSPAAAGTAFALGTNGLVIPTAAGAISPNGYTVFLGSPPVKPPTIPGRTDAAPQDDTARVVLAGFRPKTRPSDLSDSNERAQLDGLTRNELAGFRPSLRPRSIQQQAKAAADAAAAEKAAAEAKAAEAEKKDIDTDGAVETALAAAASNFTNETRFATKASARPDTRPRNFSRIVRRAKRTPQPKAQQETRVASTATIAPRTVKPKVPTKTSVARQATVKNAINLRKVNLIGVYGKPSNRRALVRLSNGRYKKVTVGDRIDGGRVSAISNSELRYSKRGKNVVLRMP